MNERIKQLWEQAAKTTQGDSWEEQTKFMERFAELIVKECIDWIDGSPTTEEGSLILSKHFIIANLKHHFGVEE